MATCNPATLLSRGKDFRKLSRREVQVAINQLLCEKLNGSAPAAPTNLDISDGSVNGGTVLTWSQGVAPTTNEVWVSINGAAFIQRTSQAGALTTYTDPNLLANGDVWQYKVRAVTGTPSVFGNTVRVGRALDFNNTGLVSFSYADMVHIYDDLTIQNEAVLPSILLPALRVVGTDFLVLACPALTTINVAALKTVGGNFGPQGNVSLTTLNCAALVTVGAAFAPSSNSAIASLSVPVLASASVVDCSFSGYTSLSFPALTTLPGDFSFTLCNSLTSVSAPVLTSIGGNLIGSFTPITSFTMTVLASVGGVLDLGTCNNLASLSLPALTNVGNDLTFGSTAALVTASFPLLVGLAGNFNGNDCPAMTTLTIPNIVFTDGTIIQVNNGALNPASINSILHRGVVSGTTTCDYELQGGTNAAPSGAGIADKATLIGLGNTVNTN